MDERQKDTQNGLRFVNPPGLYDPTPNGYSHLALFPPGWRLILPSGQGGETEDEQVVISLSRGAPQRVIGDRPGSLAEPTRPAV